MTRARDLAKGTFSGDLTVDTNTLVVDSANNRVGVGTSSPIAKLHTLSLSTTATVAKFGATNYGNLGTTYVEIGTQYGDGGSRIGNINPTGNLSTLVFETMTAASGVFAERMRIDSAGRVTMPYQPFGAASISGGAVGTGVKGFYSPYSISRGGLSVDNTNGRFTVPVAGAYLVGHHNLGDSTSGVLSVQIRVNGTVSTGGYTQDTNGSNDNLSQQLIIQLSANDYVDFNAASGAFHNNQNYSRFYICLLG